MSEDLIILQNNDTWMEVMQLNTRTQDTKVLKRNDGIKTSGHYTKINGDAVMFYRKGKSLYFNVKNNEICLDDNNISLSYKRRGDDIIFSIYRGNNAMYSISYSSFRNDPINKEDFDFNSDKEEDYDIFLFVYNVVNNPERRNMIYT